MVISKFDLMLFSPHRKGVGFLGDYEKSFWWLHDSEEEEDDE